MNRYLEHDGKKRGLKSQDCAKVLKAVAGYIPDNWESNFRQVTGALQAADYIALAEKHAPYTTPEPRVFVYEQLDRYKNEWFAIPRGRWLQLYNEENKRVCNARTYGPTLRIKYPCGYVGFKGIPADTKADKAPEPKSKDRKQIEDLLETHEPEITRYEISYKSAIPELTVAFAPKDRDIFGSATKPTQGMGKSKLSQALEDLYSLEKPIKDLEKRRKELEEQCRKRAEDNGITVHLRVANRNKPTKFYYYRYDKEKNEWEQVLAEPESVKPEPIKPEQLDSKACRQFVEQLLAFDDLEKNRVLDIDRLLVSLLSSNQIGLLSYVLFLEGYTK